ncbi:OmpH family outer membrane protein [Ruegeria hyattellae]|uniref:OmpH family outer membrane protein n=1 Tax=Ruegeria hyattellae TaxID=3233337 RepID=UPI00355B8DF2
MTVALLFGAPPAAAQDTGLPTGQILTISADRLFADSNFGQRVLSELEAEGIVLSAENERIIAELSREEESLTERRATTDPQAFRALADAFDKKVEEHRANQKAKLDALTLNREKARAVFFEAVRPVLETLMRDTGAGVILERSDVFLSANATDITADAIARINEAIGDGADLEIQIER